MDDSEKQFYRNLIQSWKDYIVEYHCVVLLWKGFSVNDVVEVTGLDSRVVRQYRRKILAFGTLTGRIDTIVGPRPSEVWYKAQLLRYMRAENVRNKTSGITEWNAGNIG